MRCLRALAVVVAVIVFAAAPSAVAQQYPPGTIDVTCNITTAAPGAEVTCTISTGTFAPGTPVTVSVRVTVDGRPVAVGPPLALTTGLLAAPGDDAGSGSTLTRQVTAAADGSATAAFQIPEEAAPGPVDVSFEGTAPDGSTQVVTENAVLQVSTPGSTAGTVVVPDPDSRAWIPIVALLGAAGVGIVVAARRRRRTV